MRRGDDARPVGAEGGGPHLTAMPRERRDVAPEGYVPQSHGLVARRSEDVRPVRAEGDGKHRTFMSRERGDLAPGRRVPQLRGPANDVTTRVPSGLKAAELTQLKSPPLS